MADGSIRPDIVQAAERHDLSPSLVAAVVMVESGGDPWAVRAEPGYRWLWDEPIGVPFRSLRPDEASSLFPPKDFAGPAGVSRATEWFGQKCSWGLMQIMGATAREHGFRGVFLSSLCQPTIGLEYGCKHLSNLVKRYKGNLLDAVSAYNQGTARRDDSGKYRNQRYVDKVVAEARKLGHKIEPT